MNFIESKGQKLTISAITSILLISLHSIYYYQTNVVEINKAKLIQQIVRFVLTLVLLILVYKGKNWARKVCLFLFGLGIIIATISIFTLQVDLFLKIPFLVMIIVYGYTFYLFKYSDSFKAFMQYQNK